MEKKFRIIGLMSGTSLDGVDIALCEFTKSESWSFKILFAQTFNYNEQWKEILANTEDLSAIDLARNDVFLGQLFGNLTNAFIDYYKIDRNTIDAVASHGHTIFHQPEISLTTQIGNGAQIAAITGIKTICDFRTTDVALGGQGAPLVPIGDDLLFSEYTSCLNLGGIANVSFTKEKNRISFDIGLANMVNNYLCRNTTHGFDDKGGIAASGKIDQAFLDEMNVLSYFNLPFPKSLGKEFFINEFKPILDKYKLSLEDKLHTFGVHLGMQIGKQLQTGTCLVTGGGTYNDFWLQQISKNTSCELIKPNNEIIDFKEALIFSFLGVLRLRKESNSLKSVTGASKNAVGGCIYWA